MKAQPHVAKGIRNPENQKGSGAKNLGPGKSHAGYYKGRKPGSGPVHVDNTMTPENTRTPMADSLDFDRYSNSGSPLHKAIGLHHSTKISPMMAQKYLGHSNPKVASQAKKIVGGYHSSIGSNTQGPRSANQNSKA